MCQGGTVSRGPHRLFWPLDGITVELWLTTGTPDQSDRWMLNTVGASTSGHRLGFVGGRIGWQIPQEPWSHMLTSPQPAPLGQWVHVAATYDNRTMRLYIDAEEMGSLEHLGAIGRADANLCIGGYAAGNSRAMFDRVLDEVRIYDRALTADEVSDHYEEVRT